jgi:ADP-ribose pyrophosphatase
VSGAGRGNEAGMRPDDSRTVFAGRLVSVTVERWGEHEKEIVEHPGAVAIVAVDARRVVTLVRQSRAPARAKLVELPAGTIEPGEEPLATAQRELAEETGLVGGEWREAARMWTTPGFCNERMHLFFAEGVEAGDASPAEDEDVEVVHWPLDEVAGRLSEIEDAKTLAGLLLYLRETGR